MLRLTVPSKTFLLGEYLALLGGPALVLTTAPRFILEVEEKNTDELAVWNIPNESPGQRFINQNLDFFKKFSIKFYDPYGGLGGFGASSAQFALVAALKNFYQKKKIHFAELLNTYKNLVLAGHDYKPSGTDVLAQLYGGITYFNKNKHHLAKIVWPFPQLCFALIHTGNKTLTHSIIESFQNDIDEKLLRKIALYGYHNLINGNAEEFCQALNSYGEVLQKDGLIVPETINLLNKIRKKSFILAAKGCGALGADVILVILPKQKSKAFLHWASKEKLNISALGQYAQFGLSIQTLEKNQLTEQVVTVDARDYQMGIEEKIKAHKEAILHRAFSVFIFRRKRGEVELLLQQRATDKYHSGDLWTNSCCSHPRPGEDILESAKLRLQAEMGIKTELFAVGAFKYKAKLNNSLIEHEVDHVFIGTCAEHDIQPNKQEVKNHQWITLAALEKKLAKEPKNFTPWLTPALKLIFKSNIINKIV